MGRGYDGVRTRIYAEDSLAAAGGAHGASRTAWHTQQGDGR